MEDEPHQKIELKEQISLENQHWKLGLNQLIA